MPRHDGRTLYRPRTKAEVQAEYEAAATRPEDHQKAKWATREGMLAGFGLVRDLVRWDAVESWLDVGCGSGALFGLALEDGFAPARMLGVDLSPALAAQAERRFRKHPRGGAVRILAADLERIPEAEGPFDLVTLLGVLQQCGARPEAVLAACAARLRPGGQLFLTTKNARWEAFTSGRLAPEPSHSWFDPEEIFALARGLGLRLEASGGFIPREGRLTDLDQAHSFYLLGVLQ